MAQPINSWKNESDKKEINEEKSIDDISIRSCASSTSSEQSLGAKIQEVAQNGFAQSNIAKSNEQMKPVNFDGTVLMPGLTGKPPLPRKKDDKIDNRKVNKKGDNLTTFANYTDDLKDCINFDYPKECYGDTLIDKSFRLEIMPADNTSDYESRESNSDSNYETHHESAIQYQNWIFDENEAKKRENETDLYLKSLRKQNEEIQELIKKSELALENETITRKEFEYESKEVDDFDLKFDKFFRKDKSQTPDDDSPPKNDTNPKVKNAIKTIKCNNTKKLNNGIIKKPIDGNRPKKFVPTPMRHYKEYQEKQAPDVESWMSQTKQTTDPMVPAATNSKSNYSDVLDSLQELEKVVKGEENDSIEEEEAVLDNKDDNKLEEEEQQYDDIASILEVLEEQDKISR